MITKIKRFTLNTSNIIVDIGNRSHLRLE